MTPCSAGTVNNSPRAVNTTRLAEGEMSGSRANDATFSVRGLSVARSVRTWTLTSVSFSVARFNR